MKSLFAAVLLALAVFGVLLLWLTPYRYSASGRIRTHRLTGRAYVLHSHNGILRWRVVR